MRREPHVKIYRKDLKNESHVQVEGRVMFKTISKMVF